MLNVLATVPDTTTNRSSLNDSGIRFQREFMPTPALVITLPHHKHSASTPKGPTTTWDTYKCHGSLMRLDPVFYLQCQEALDHCGRHRDSEHGRDHYTGARVYCNEHGGKLPATTTIAMRNPGTDILATVVSSGTTFEITSGDWGPDLLRQKFCADQLELQVSRGMHLVTIRRIPYWRGTFCSDDFPCWLADAIIAASCNNREFDFPCRRYAGDAFRPQLTPKP